MKNVNIHNVIKDEQGKITNFVLDNGATYSLPDILNMMDEKPGTREGQQEIADFTDAVSPGINFGSDG